MSDATDRSRSDGDIRERIRGVEVKVDRIEARLAELGPRSHDMAQHMQRLTTASEEAGDARAAMAQKIDSLAERVAESTLASARAETSLGATLAAHIEQCKTDKAEIKQMVANQNAKQDRMHAENRGGLEKLEGKLGEGSKQLTRLEIRLAGYAAVALVIGWALSHADIVVKLLS